MSKCIGYCSYLSRESVTLPSHHHLINFVMDWLNLSMHLCSSWNVFVAFFQMYLSKFLMSVGGVGGRGGQLTSLDASFAQCFAFWKKLSKTSTLMFFSKTLSIQVSTVSACSPGVNFRQPRTAGAVSRHHLVGYFAQL